MDQARKKPHARFFHGHWIVRGGGVLPDIFGVGSTVELAWKNLLYWATSASLSKDYDWFELTQRGCQYDWDFASIRLEKMKERNREDSHV